MDLADKILYLGLTAPGSHDYGPMPFSPVYPRVGLHVNAANTILKRQFIHETSDVLIFFIALVCALPVAYLASRLHPIVGLAFGALLTTVYLQIADIAFNRFGIWLPTMQLVTTVISTYLAVVLHNVLREQQTRRKVQGAFSTYVTPSIVQQVLRDPGMLRLGGQRRTMTVFFSDVAGFTTISERSTPEELVAILNQYFDAMTGIIFRHEGTLDKYEGDGMMAFWNAPADQKDHAYRACCAAIDCVKCLKTTLFPKWQAEGKPLLSTRIGINTGSMAVGNMGSSTRMAYTVIGDAVNLAARLESANKEYGTHIMTSEFTLDLVKDRIAVRELDLLAVKGKVKPVRVYEVLDRAEELTPDAKKLLEDYNAALDHYHGRRWPEAVESFGVLAERYRDDGPCKTYLTRCRKYLASPPPPDWNGVWTLTTK
jgi:adenylate cyclase